MGFVMTESRYVPGSAAVPRVRHARRTARKVGISAMLMIWALASNAHARPRSCHAAKLNAASRHLDCRLKAAAQFAKSLQTPLDQAKLNSSHAKCDASLSASFALSESQYGSGCASSIPSAKAISFLADTEGRVRDGFPYAYPLLVTGQVTPLGLGSDGDQQRGDPRALVDNLDGTVTDERTGLMWEKKDSQDPTSIHWVSRLFGYGEFLAVLNSPRGCFAGHCDWRYPDVAELISVQQWEVAVSEVPDLGLLGPHRIYRSATASDPNLQPGLWYVGLDYLGDWIDRDAVHQGHHAIAVRDVRMVGGSPSRAFLDPSDSLLD